MSIPMFLFDFVNRVWLARTRHRTERGQATAEYALVLLGAAAVALALISWVGRGHVATFFDAIFNHLMAAAK